MRFVAVTKKSTAVFVAAGLVACAGMMTQIRPTGAAAVVRRPVRINYGENPVYLGKGSPEQIAAPQLTGGTDVRFTVTPALPPGLTLDPVDGAISGTPSASSGFSPYTVTARNAAGSASATLIMAVFPQKPPLLHPLQAYAGNSLPGASDRDKHYPNFVPDDIEGMAVLPDGGVLTNSYYDEGGNTAAAFKNGGYLQTMHDLHGWNRDGGDAIAIGGKYVFVAMAQHGGFHRAGFPYAPCGTFYGVRRYTAYNGMPAPYISLSDPAYVNEDLWDGSFRTISEDVQDPSVGKAAHAQCFALAGAGGALSSRGERVRGLAVLHRRLFVSDGAARKIRVFDVESMAEIPQAEITLQAPDAGASAHPWQIALDPAGMRLWVIQREAGSQTGGRIVPYSLRPENYGRISGPVIRGVADPSALALSPNGAYVLAADDAPAAQQVDIFDVRGHALSLMRPVNRIGTAGGAFASAAAPGTDTPWTFHRIVGVGTDAAGKVYVATNGHGIDQNGGPLEQYGDLFTLIRIFTPAAQLGFLDPRPRPSLEYHNWIFVDNLAFAGNDVYSKYQHFRTDGSISSTGELKLRHAGYTTDHKAYPGDPRLTTSRAGTWTETVNGHTLVFLSSQSADRGLAVYRRAGETLVPAAFLFMTANPAIWPQGFVHPGSWQWTDENGDGRFSQNEFHIAARGLTHSQTWAWNTDARGDVWIIPEFPEGDGFASYRVRLQSFDARGVPHYQALDDAQRLSAPSRADFARIERFSYDRANDVAFISGYPRGVAVPGLHWGMAGTVVRCYVHWSDPARRTLRWSSELPYGIPLPDVWDAQNAPATYPIVMTAAGKYVFVVYTSPAWIDVLDARTGRRLSRPIVPQTRFGGDFMLTDLAHGAVATVRPDGKTYLSVEDDARGKNMLYIFP